MFESKPVSEIKTLEEARTNLIILDARRAEIGGVDEFDQNSRPILEKLISDLTELPDLGSMLQDNSRDKLQEFVSNGYTLYVGKVDEQRLRAHVARATELLNSASSMPEIPQSLDELQQMQARVSANEFQNVPTEWLETLNKSTRAAQLQERYGDKLSVDYIMSDERTQRELQLLKSVVTQSLGSDHYLLADLNIALGTPFVEAVELPKLSDVTITNWRSLQAEALEQGDPYRAEQIGLLGETYDTAAKQGIDIASVTEANWMSLAAAARAGGEVSTAEVIEQLGQGFTADSAKETADASVPEIADVTATNWRSLQAAAIEVGKTDLAATIGQLGADYDKAADDGIDIASVTAANWPSKAAAARAAGDIVTAEVIEQLGKTYDSRAEDADTSGNLPLLSAVRKENWRSLSAQATSMGDTGLATSINSLGAAYDAAAKSGDTRTTDLLGDVSQVLARAGTDIRNTNEKAEAYIGAIDSAYRLNTILQNNPDINYFFGGAVPSVIMGAVGEIGAIASLVKGNDVNSEDALASVASFERNMEEKFLSGNISEDARSYAVYKAQEARLAFQIARLQQGPAGVISNKDFESAIGQVRSSSNSKTFEASLRGLVGAEEVKVLTSVDNLLRNPQIQIAQQLQEELGLDFTSGALRTMEERVSDVGADAALTWIKGGPSTAPAPIVPDTAPTVPQGAIDMLKANPDLWSAFEKKYGVSADTYLGE